MKPLKNKRSGFRQKAEQSNFWGYAAVCRHAATVNQGFSEIS
ncbi:MAG: hypothetical protein ABSC89_04385 [Verrucomicrobiota bacterium]